MSRGIASQAIIVTLSFWLVAVCVADEQAPQDQGTGLSKAISPPILESINGAELVDNVRQDQPVQLASDEQTLQENTSAETLEEKQNEVTSQLRVALLQEDAQKAITVDPAPNADETEVDMLKQVNVIIAQQKSATATLDDIKAKETRVEEQLQKLATGRLDEEPPYSIVKLDQANDTIQALKDKAESLQGSVLAARDAVERARKSVEEKKQVLRQLKEKTETTDLKPAELAVRMAEEMLILRRQELAIEEANERVRAEELKLEEGKRGIMAAQVVFSKTTLNEQVAEIDARERELKRQAELLKTELKFADDRWLVARQSVDSTPSPAPDLLERVDALKLAQQAIRQEQAVVNQRLQRLPMLRTVWERRYLAMSGAASREELRTWLEETTKQIDQLQLDRRARSLKKDELDTTLKSVENDLNAADNGEIKRWLQSQQVSLKRQMDVLDESIRSIDTTERALKRLTEQIGGRTGRTFADWVADTWSYLKKIWNYELAAIEDTSLTVGKVFSSVLFLFFGYFAAKWLSLLLGRRLPKLGVEEAGATAIESLSFYTLLVAFALAALKYANVPLTVFTFLGGAIAIGVGFGSQNILNNFISGLILLAERPIKVGDLIFVDETYGNVTKIGARSTQIRTGENQDIIVPNSKFLESNVVNLTRSDDRLRTSITVGVAYGSPLEQVVDILEKASAETRDVQERPKPMVWFTDFGDNSLVFQIHFWLRARTVTQMRRVESDVRLNINRIFRERGIVIAFPQRDVHLQTLSPLEFRVVGESRGDDGVDALREAG